MRELSFGTGAQAHRRVGNVFLAFAEVKRAMFVASDGSVSTVVVSTITLIVPSERSRETYPIDYGNRLPTISIFTFPGC